MSFISSNYIKDLLLLSKSFIKLSLKGLILILFDRLNSEKKLDVYWVFFLFNIGILTMTCLTTWCANTWYTFGKVNTVTRPIRSNRDTNRPLPNEHTLESYLLAMAPTKARAVNINALITVKKLNSENDNKRTNIEPNTAPVNLGHFHSNKSQTKNHI
ncbi:hypothetical protein BpHYR1_035657 [Brachionus plicatilis]|uniref:Uncharacterized protein n=1 Tax=Brachionus plicatilis TaxID=10195 RepID=A0A3M7QMD2_BRAPC|nr:hypothetical protein BpHYR1_035657 [Brachionus plicatilis]